MATMALRLLIYDRTCRGAGLRPGLSHAWRAGSWLYRGLGRFDAARAASCWDEALAWLAALDTAQRIAEIQYWGHGKWGCARIADDVLDRSALQPGHPLRARLVAVRERLAPDALWWFRTCETFGATAGHDFARAWTDFFGAPAAGHTYIIGYYQSGLHRLAPGCAPHWADDEGLERGTAAEPEQALWSERHAPNTITCLQGHLPDPTW